MDYSLAKIITALTAGGLLVYLAITVMRDNAANRLNRLAGAMLFFAGFGPLFMGIGELMSSNATSVASFESSSAFNLFYFWEFFFPILVLFSWHYPVDRLRAFRLPWLRYVIFLPVVVHVILMLFFTDINGWLANMEAATTSESMVGLLLKPIAYLISIARQLMEYLRTFDKVIFGLVNLIYITVAWYFLETGSSYVTNPRLQTQARLALWGLRSGLGLFSIALVVEMFGLTGPNAWLITTLYLAAAFFGAGFIAYAMVRFQLFDVRLVFRQSFVYTFSSAILVGIYILAVLYSEQFLTPIFEEQAQTVSYLFVVLILLLFQPINNGLDNLIRSMFMRTRADYRNIIERFSRQIISMFDPGQLRLTIEETLKTSLLVERVFFVLYDDKLKEYAFTESTDMAETTIVDREDLMLRGINLLDSPTNYESLAQYSEGSKLAERLKEFGVRMILPMKDADHLLGFVALTDKVAGYRYTAEDFNLLGVLGNQMVSALTNARLYVDSLERLRLQEEVNMARNIQVNLLPASPPKLDKYSICAGSTPSLTVGGDFYDFVRIKDSNRISMVIADASGKGIPAALMITQIQAIIRSEITNGNRISTILKNTNQQIAESSTPETYATLFYGELDASTGDFHYANAGHNYPIVVRANGSHELLECGGPVIGAFPHMEYEASVVKLNPGDLLFLFTDGLSEAMDHQDVEYGEDRIREFLTNSRHDEPEVIMNSIIADVQKFSPNSPPKDDTTIITLKMNPESNGRNVS